MTTWLLISALRAAVVLLGAMLLFRVLHRAAPRIRAAVLGGGLVGALLVPLLAWFAPQWEVSVPIPWSSAAADDPMLGLDADQMLALLLSAPPAASASAVETAIAPAPRVALAGVAVAIWAIGALASLSWLLLGLLRTRSIIRGAEVLADPAWIDVAADLAQRIGVTRRVRVLISEQVAMPMTGGIVRPVVLLPTDAQTWSDERRAVVLSHEFVHVRRMDWLVQIAARLTCAAHWFNPLAWLAAQRLHLERERACDAGVIALGTPPATYARHLLDIALTRPSRTPTPMAALAMAHRTQLEARLMSIRKNRPARRGLTAVLPALLGLSVVALSSAVIRPVAGPPEELEREIARMEKELTAAKAKLADLKSATAHEKHLVKVAPTDGTKGTAQFKVMVRDDDGELQEIEIEPLHEFDVELEPMLRDLSVELEPLQDLKLELRPLLENLEIKLEGLHEVEDFEPFIAQLKGDLAPLEALVDLHATHGGHADHDAHGDHPGPDVHVAPKLKALLKLRSTGDGEDQGFAVDRAAIQRLVQDAMQARQQAAGNGELHRHFAEAMKEHAHAIDGAELHQHLIEAMKEHAHAIDGAELHKHFTEAMEGIDADQIRARVHEALQQQQMKSIDADAIRKQIGDAIKSHHVEFDTDAIRQLVDQARASAEQARKQESGQGDASMHQHWFHALQADQQGDLKALVDELRALKQELAELRRPG